MINLTTVPKTETSIVLLAVDGGVLPCTWSDNKVHELTTMCLLSQQWTDTSVWFDNGISAFHGCVVVDLWQSLS
jgi:hypothetical protein